jgi:hypothetical protein
MPGLLDIGQDRSIDPDRPTNGYERVELLAI